MPGYNGKENHEDHSTSEYNRPRRPAPDTISYLRSLPLDLDTARTEIQEYNSHRSTSKNQDFPVTLAAALQALYETRHELASLAGDEHAAECLEQLCRIALPVSRSACVMVLMSMKGYMLHTAAHRYGSHVLQTILGLVAITTNDIQKDLALDEWAPEQPNDEGNNYQDTFMLDQLIIALVEELQPAISEFAVHMCASHVVRSVLCLLGGVQLANTNYKNNEQHRGKVKSKKRKANTKDKNDSDSFNTKGETRMIYIHDSVLDSDTTQNALQILTDALIPGNDKKASTPGTLQQWACHASAAPVVTVLLQVWTYRYAPIADTPQPPQNSNIMQRQLDWEEQNSMGCPDRQLGLRRPEPVYTSQSPAHYIVQRLLCWDDSLSDASQQPYAADMIYGLSGEARGSHVMETILRHSPDNVYADILECGQWLRANNTTTTTSAETTTLQDYIHDDVSNFLLQTVISTLRTKTQAEAMVKVLTPLATTILDPSKKRRGILWRLIEWAATSAVGDATTCQKGVVSLLQAGIDSLLQLQESKSDKEKWSQYVMYLLQLRMKDDDSRVTVDVPGTRALYHLLHFESCKAVVNGLLDLAPDNLEQLAKDALGSRCTLDALLEPSNEVSVFRKAHKKLLNKLQGRWVSLATDRVGHHLVLKLFAVLPDMTDKATLVDEMILGKSRLNGNSMGRAVLEGLQVRVYESQGREEWAKLIQKKQDTEEWLQQIVEGRDDAHSNENEKQNRRKEKQRKGTNPMIGKTSVDVILNAISMPDDKVM